jgi:hypothetical protein
MVDHRKVLRPLSVVVLVAAAVMFGALFMPFVRQGCIFCPIALPGSTFQLPTFSLMQGLDGWIVLCFVVALGLEAVVYVRTGVRLAAVAVFLLSVAALGMCIFEGVDSAGRVVGLDATSQPIPVGGNSLGGHSLTPPASWNYGLYVFFSAAVVAVVASFAAVALSCRTRLRPMDPIAVPIAAP